MRIKDGITQWEERSGNEVSHLTGQSGPETLMPGEQLRSVPQYEKLSVDIKKVGKRAVEAAEKQFIQRTLQITRWNRRKAAQMMRVSYKALLYKIKDYGLDRGEDA